MAAIQERFPFAGDFQKRLLAVLVQDLSFLSNSVDLIRPEYFEDRSVNWAYSAVREFYLKYNRPPEEDELVNELRKEVTKKAVFESDSEAYEVTVKAAYKKVKNSDYVREEVVRFCRNQALFKEVLQAASAIKDSASPDEIIEAIPAKMQQALKVGDYLEDDGSFYFRDLDSRIFYRAHKQVEDIFPTGIPQLDAYLGGGLKRGQLGVVVGGTGSGKSIALPYIGKRNILDGRKVSHISLELKEMEVAERYDSLISRVPISNLISDEQAVREGVEWYYNRYGEALNIKFFPAKSVGTAALKAYAESLQNKDFPLDLMLVDYEDLLRPSVHRERSDIELGEISAELKGVAGALDVGLWTATQLNRTGYGKEEPSLEELAGSFMKAFEPDVMILIGRTPAEAKKGIINIHIGKNRNGPDKITIQIHSAYDRMSFVDLGKTKYSLAEEIPRIDPDVKTVFDPPPSGGGGKPNIQDVLKVMRKNLGNDK